MSKPIYGDTVGGGGSSGLRNVLKQGQGEKSLVINEGTAIGAYSVASGKGTTAIGEASHAGGYGTIASVNYQTAIGTFNVENANALFIVGNGTKDEDTDVITRSNAFEVITKDDDISIKIASVELTSEVLQKLINFLGTDATLTESGKAADAKVTGDRIGALEAALGSYITDMNTLIGEGV